MGMFSRTPAPSVPTPAEPVRTREELTVIANSQRAGDFTDPGRGPAQQNGRPERVIT
jgi:hypothetical protein